MNHTQYIRLTLSLFAICSSYKMISSEEATWYAPLYAFFGREEKAESHYNLENLVTQFHRDFIRFTYIPSMGREEIIPERFQKYTKIYQNGIFARNSFPIIEEVVYTNIDIGKTVFISTFPPLNSGQIVSKKLRDFFGEEEVMIENYYYHVHEVKIENGVEHRFYIYLVNNAHNVINTKEIKEREYHSLINELADKSSDYIARDLKNKSNNIFTLEGREEVNREHKIKVLQDNLESTKKGYAAILKSLRNEKTHLEFEKDKKHKTENERDQLQNQIDSIEQEIIKTKQEKKEKEHDLREQIKNLEENKPGKEITIINKKPTPVIIKFTYNNIDNNPEEEYRYIKENRLWSVPPDTKPTSIAYYEKIDNQAVSFDYIVSLMAETQDLSQKTIDNMKNAPSFIIDRKSTQKPWLIFFDESRLKNEQQVPLDQIGRDNIYEITR